VAIKELLSDVYLSKRASLINLDKATVDVVAGSPLAHSDTVLFTTADQYGNACAYIQSNYAGFGSHAVPEGCGFTLHNRGSNFFLKEGHANCLQGGKRPYHTIIPAAVTKANGELYVVFGVMGGFMQVQGQFCIKSEQETYSLLRSIASLIEHDPP
jgi:gamma-glutamyltranspeptidase/glutathione hydrolase